MIKISVGDQLIQEAKEEAQKMGIPLNSITEGKGSTAGFVGKHIVAHYLEISEGLQFKTYNYDMVHNGKRIQVKTKRCTSAPFPNYECSIADYNPDQICDYYVFTRVTNDMHTGWILGYMPRDEYFKRAKTYEKGDYDPENHFMFKCRTYNLPISELYDMQDLLGEKKLTKKEEKEAERWRQYWNNIDEWKALSMRQCGFCNYKSVYQSSIDHHLQYTHKRNHPPNEWTPIMDEKQYLDHEDALAGRTTRRSSALRVISHSDDTASPEEEQNNGGEQEEL